MSFQMLQCRANKAATIIQAVWKRFATVRWYVETCKKRLAACSKIQSNYRLIRFLKMGPKIRRAKRDAAATAVQKYMKGYLCQKHSMKALSNLKLEQSVQFFQQIKIQYQMSAQITIAYHMRRFLKLKRLEELNKAENARLKKLKVGAKGGKNVKNQSFRGSTKITATLPKPAARPTPPMKGITVISTKTPLDSANNKPNSSLETKSVPGSSQFQSQPPQTSTSQY